MPEIGDRYSVPAAFMFGRGDGSVEVTLVKIVGPGMFLAIGNSAKERAVVTEEFLRDAYLVKKLEPNPPQSP